MIKGMDEKRVLCIRHVTQITKLLQGKWALPILCAMRNSPVRLSQLTRLIPAASKKALCANLRALERAEIVERRDMSDKVLHMEYSFSDDMRESLESFVDHLEGWGRTLNAKTEKTAGPSPE
jgi:DNA-binding HxlR family transcriptional regulator